VVISAYAVKKTPFASRTVSATYSAQACTGTERLPGVSVRLPIHRCRVAHMTGRNSYVVVFKAEYEAGKLWDGVGHGHALHQGVDASFQRRPLASL